YKELKDELIKAVKSLSLNQNLIDALVERLHHLRAKLGFHRRQRKVGFVLVLFLLFGRQAFAADIGDVVVAGAGATGL
ncbi:hypothetical protein ACC817_36630, partial [Rhizobium ruizarguesonis]